MEPPQTTSPQTKPTLESIPNIEPILSNRTTFASLGSLNRHIGVAGELGIFYDSRRNQLTARLFDGVRVGGWALDLKPAITPNSELTASVLLSKLNYLATDVYKGSINWIDVSWNDNEYLIPTAPILLSTDLQILIDSDVIGQHIEWNRSKWCVELPPAIDGEITVAPEICHGLDFSPWDVWYDSINLDYKPGLVWSKGSLATAPAFKVVRDPATKMLRYLGGKEKAAFMPVLRRVG